MLIDLLNIKETLNHIFSFSGYEDSEQSFNVLLHTVYPFLVKSLVISRTFFNDTLNNFELSVQ